MDVRMGVLSHTILQYKTKEKFQDRKANKIVDAEDLYDFEWAQIVCYLYYSSFSLIKNHIYKSIIKELLCEDS